mmetsp:Transcript_33080/g.59608  ORF Transcript_33080/g.59608 Transcript_33080/m.59608 type:complete len:212 (-) Transcript_33080:1057-1692(-)
MLAKKAFGTAFVRCRGITRLQKYYLCYKVHVILPFKLHLILIKPHCRKGRCKIAHFLPQLHQLGIHAWSHSTHFPKPLNFLPLLRTLQPHGNFNGPIEIPRHFRKVLLLKSAGRQRRRSHAYTPGIECRRVPRHGILIAGNARQFEDAFDARSVNAAGGLDIHQDEVVVGPAADHVVSHSLQFGRQTGTVFENLFLIFHECGSVRLLQRHR